MEYKIDDTTITFQVQYTKRSSFDLTITPEGHITVKAPNHSSEEDIYKFLLKNKKPLLKVQQRIDNPIYISREKSYHEEENFLLFGKVYKLSELLPEIPETEEEIQLALKRFYTKKTKKIIKERVSYYEKIIGVKASGITIVDSVKAWGTCNSNRELTVNYRLSMAPLSSIDSVVIHELCHILHLNHDRSFWRKVGSYDPNYEKNHSYLDRLGFVMTV